MEKFVDVITSRSLRPVSGAIVTVKTEAGAVATIYSDNGTTATDNPFTTGATGEVGFYAANGKYTLNIVAPNTSAASTLPIILFDPDESPFISDGT
jgi:hypothetical protein